MSTTTKNLDLIKPEITDEIHQTIQDLSNNFQKLDDAAELYVTEEPTDGFWNRGNRVWFRNPEIGGYIGLVNVRSGQAAPKWKPLHSYELGDKVVASEDNGHYFICTKPGASGPNEPIWSLSTASETEDTQGKTTWQPSKYYDLYDIVVPPVNNDRFYLCTVAGRSGDVEPVWSLNEGSVTEDNEVVWATYFIVKWKEAGSAVLFRPFGKIE